LIGTLYGVGVGPGDPELMTLKAVRIIRKCDVIAVPAKEPKESFAYKIVSAAVSEIADKELIGINIPMINEREKIIKEHENGAHLIQTHIERGKNVAYLTLGDPTIYCSFGYIARMIEAKGFHVEYINGVTSFCAAAARLSLPLAEWDETLHIIPVAHKMGTSLSYEGNYVIMKPSGHMKEVKELLNKTDFMVKSVENCGCSNERVYSGVDEIPDDAGYYTIIIAKQVKS